MTDTILFRRNSLRTMGYLLSKKISQSFTRDEQMILDRRELEEMLDILREAAFPKERWTAWDSNVAMDQIWCIPGGMTDTPKAI